MSQFSTNLEFSPFNQLSETVNSPLKDIEKLKQGEVHRSPQNPAIVSKDHIANRDPSRKRGKPRGGTFIIENGKPVIVISI